MLTVIVLMESKEESNRDSINLLIDYLKMIDVSDRFFWIRDGKVDRIETRAEVAVGAVG